MTILFLQESLKKIELSDWKGSLRKLLLGLSWCLVRSNLPSSSRTPIYSLSYIIICPVPNCLLHYVYLVMIYVRCFQKNKTLVSSQSYFCSQKIKDLFLCAIKGYGFWLFFITGTLTIAWIIGINHHRSFLFWNKIWQIK